VKAGRARSGSMVILMFAITLMASLTVPYLYLIHMKEKRINDTTTICRETMELITAVNDHYMNFIRLTGAYIDLVEKQSRDIKLNYEKGDITRSAMLTQIAALTTNYEQEVLIKNLWQESGTTLAMPVGSESSSTFISRLGIEDELNGDIGDSDLLDSVTVNSYIESWVTSPSVLSHIPQVWIVEITVTPKERLELGTVRKHLLGKIKTASTQEDECVKINVLKAEEDGVSIKIEYSIRGILDDSLSVTGM
jgi:hypothetical protein